MFPGLSKEKFNTLMASNFNARFNILNEVFYYKKCNFEGYIALNYGRKKYTKESKLIYLEQLPHYTCTNYSLIKVV